MKLLGFLFLLSVYLLAKPKTVLSSCADVDFCSQLRNRELQDVYNVDVDTIQIDDIGIIKFNLVTDSDLEDLTVTIYAYKDDVLRVKIKEFDSPRFELSDVFNGAPSLAGVKSVNQTDSELLIITNVGSEIYAHFQPFNLEFFRDDVLELAIPGNRLFVDNPSNSLAFSVGFTFPVSDYLYGLHERSPGLWLNYTKDLDPYRLYNRDRPQFATFNDTECLYGSIPFIYGHGSEFTAGIFLHNAAQQYIDILQDDDQKNTAYFMAEGGTLDAFVFLGPTPAEVLRQYLLLTGVPYMPPLWSLGYHQSRYSYMTQEEVKEVVANFDNYDFPLDAIWLDIDHTDGKRYFTWNPDSFSDPIEMQNNVSATNRKIVVISDPHFKVDDNYFIYTDAINNELFVKNANGTPFEGNCHPGASVWLDFLNSEARAYYASLYSFEKYSGTSATIAGIWNDMNEPSVFSGPEGTMPGDCLHYGNIQHKELHNVYGMLQTRATHLGLLERDNATTRPFILSRSTFAGSQRYTAVWTGDIGSSWEYLETSYSMCLNSNIMGLVFCGADIGGFIGDPDDELYQRWIQAGAWLPFFRVHSTDSTQRREPWLFSEDFQNVFRGALRLRYQHLPVWYTLFKEHISYKLPVIRPLFFVYPDDSNVFDIYNQLLLGENIMVRAVFEAGVTSVPVYFPGGENEYWISVTGDLLAYQGGGDPVDINVDINNIPIYYRAGSIIPTKSTARPSSTEMYDDGYTLYVNLNLDSTAHGTLYMDDTTSLNYLNYVEYNYISVDYENKEITFTKIDTHANSDQFNLKIDSVVVRQITNKAETNGKVECIETVYTHDSNGKLLKSSTWNFKNSMQGVMKLSL